MLTKVDGTVEQTSVGISEDIKKDFSPVSQKIPVGFFSHRRERSVSVPLITKKVDGSDEGKSTEQPVKTHILKFLTENERKMSDVRDFGFPILRRTESKKLEVPVITELQKSELSPKSDSDPTQAECESPRP
ncbi:hypothetical protein [Legionella bononiensis]|uniref:Uncharacterized protein n=1 Tax=Legionella bononiensis TaxID=2793102 RepID=A0ABS1WB29_9GAMM|nr:hypothetical protein [Legionella bononiensis]MBL7480199.1 hypothetical protein [Legionella bononiensis]MBL7526569.1 hypothetical protein [Legionella bononiensis]MBL7562937.1 hypothetical protein [Legionella bononiensis]